MEIGIVSPEMLSYPTLQRALADLRKVRKLTCLKRGPDAEWQKVKG